LFNPDGLPPDQIRALEFIESFFAFDLQDKEDFGPDEEEIFSKKNVPIINEDDICHQCEAFIASLEFYTTLEP